MCCDIVYIGTVLEKKISPIKNCQIWFKEKILFIKNEQHYCVKSESYRKTAWYWKLLQNLKIWVGTHIGSSSIVVNEQVLLPGLQIPRNATRSVNTSAILDQPILDYNPSVLKPKQKFFAKSVETIKDCWNWLLHSISPKPRVVDEALKSFKNLIKNCTTRLARSFNWNSQNLRWKSLRYSIE